MPEGVTYVRTYVRTNNLQKCERFKNRVVLLVGNQGNENGHVYICMHPRGQSNHLQVLNYVIGPFTQTIRDIFPIQIC